MGGLLANDCEAVGNLLPVGFYVKQKLLHFLIARTLHKHQRINPLITHKFASPLVL